MKQPELLREQRSLSHSILYQMKFVGNHLNKGVKIRDFFLPYFIKCYTILLHITCLILYLISNLSRYNLRNSNDLQTVDARTSQCYHSFLPSITRDWNSLSVETKQPESVNSLKLLLTKGKSTVPDHYYIDSRKTKILHTRIRTDCSSMNLDLFVKNITESPLCRCESIENAQHFFFHCKYFEMRLL